MQPDRLMQIMNLTIEEVSGVDDPANELPGWMVWKARKAVAVNEALGAAGGTLLALAPSAKAANQKRDDLGRFARAKADAEAAQLPPSIWRHLGASLVHR